MQSESLKQQTNPFARVGLTQSGLFAFALTLLLPATPVLATDFGDRTPSVTEIIDALNSTPVHPSGAPGGFQQSTESSAIKTRGIKIVHAEPKTMPRPVAGQAEPTISGRVSMVIQFELNSDRIRRRSADSLSNLATALSSETLKDRRFEVIGHTDISGPLTYNLKLSERRAQSVSEYLSVIGVDRNRATAAGRGPKELLAAVAPNSERQRRVEIRIIP